MVARPARRLDPTPAPTEPTPFADAALELRSHGLAPVPLGGDKGKATIIKWKTQKRLPSRQSLKRQIVRFPTANVGILTGLSRRLVVDVDDPELVDAMLARFGVTPLVIGTPRPGGAHLWYRSNGEATQLGLNGLKVDIKGIGGVVVVPPSRCSTGPHAGKAYTFLKGSWDDLVHLPTITPGALEDAPHVAPPSPHLDRCTPAPVAPHLGAVSEGRRNRSLYLACLGQAPYCGTEDDLLDVALTINASYLPPLSDAEVLRVARSAWGCETRGENRRGYRGHGAYVRLDERVFARLLIFDPRHGPDALALYSTLQAAHDARVARGETFAVAARAMAYQVLPWTERRIRIATKTLVMFGLLERVHDGGTGEGDAAQYTFRSPPPALVSKINTNVIIHPPAAPWHGG